MYLKHCILGIWYSMWNMFDVSSLWADIQIKWQNSVVQLADFLCRFKTFLAGFPPPNRSTWSNQSWQFTLEKYSHNKKFMSLPANHLSIKKSSCALHRIITAVNVTTAVLVGMSLPVSKTLNSWTVKSRALMFQCREACCLSLA